MTNLEKAIMQEVVNLLSPQLANSSSGCVLHQLLWSLDVDRPATEGLPARSSKCDQKFTSADSTAIAKEVTSSSPSSSSSTNCY